jgi:hypothetical protein
MISSLRVARIRIPIQQRPLINTCLGLFLFSGALLATTPAYAIISAPTEAFVTYTVQRGDSLYGLSRKLLKNPKNWPALAKLNGLNNPSLIQPGVMIDVPLSLLKLSSQPLEPLTGTILDFSGDVKINNQPVQKGTAIAQGDRLQTGANSSASLQLADGSRMQLMPRSLAEITEQGQYALKDPATSASTTWFSGVFRLAEGILEIAANKAARRAQSLKVITNTSTLGVRGTVFRVAYEDPSTATARTEVLEGLVRTDNPLQATGADVAGGYGVAFKPQDKDIKVVALLPALPAEQMPDQVIRPHVDGKLSNTAIWSAGRLSGAAGYRAEIARDAAFGQIVLQSKTAQPQVDISHLPNGTYYARIRGFDAQGIEGFNALRIVDISDAPAPPLPEPPRAMWMDNVGVAATLNITPNSLALRIFRAASDTPVTLNVVSADDPQMSRNIHTTVVDVGGQATLPPMVAGQIRYIRFTSRSAQGQLLQSRMYSLAVSDNWGHSVFSLADALQPLQEQSRR